MEKKSWGDAKPQDPRKKEDGGTKVSHIHSTKSMVSRKSAGYGKSW